MPRCVVTRLEPERPRSRRTVLELDDERVRFMPASLVARLGLEAGDSVDPGVLADQAAMLEPELARERALYLLSYRERSVGELRAKLADDGYDDDVTAAVVARLAELGLVDDVRFAEALARMLRARSYGRSRIARELSRHHIGDELALAVLEESVPTDDESERALELARRAVRGRSLTVDRLAGRLARKGFRAGTAIAAASQAIEEAGSHATSGADGGYDGDPGGP